jgi:hypothetical protein
MRWALVLLASPANGSRLRPPSAVGQPLSTCGRRVAASTFALGLLSAPPSRAVDEYTRLGAGFRGAGKTKSRFGDFELTDSGLQYKDFKLGNGEPPKKGDRVVIDWDG